MTINSYTHADYSAARKAGFRKKKPKLKGSGSYNAIVASVTRYNTWIAEMKNKAKQGKELESLKKQIAKHRGK